MTDELKIESKTKIAADAAISINRYLEELNAKLVEIGVENAYTIISDTEEIIIDLLNAVGSPTKLGTEMVIKLIQDEIGTPDEFIEQYIQDLNNAGETQISSLNLEGKLLVRRRRKVNKIKSRKEKKSNDTLSILLHYLPILYLTIGAISFFGVYFGNEHLINFGFVLYLLAWFTQTVFEVYQGRTGNLQFTVRKTIKNRYIIRGLFLLNLGLIYSIFVNEYYFGLNSELFITIMFLTFLSLETVILLRDHTEGNFPLEKNYRPAIRFITPAYLLLLLSLFFLLAPGYYEKFYYAQVLAFIAGIWAYMKKTPVTYRFYIITFAVQFTSTLLADDLFGLFIAYPFILIVLSLFISSKKIEETPKRKGPIRKAINNINRKLDDYYYGDVGNE